MFHISVLSKMLISKTKQQKIYLSHIQNKKEEDNAWWETPNYPYLVFELNIQSYN